MRKPTIYESLRSKLNREPTNAELKAEVSRIISEAMSELAEHNSRVRKGNDK